MSDTQRIKDKIDIVDFISEYVDLKSAGKNYKALCPLHNENTPSFMVNRDRNMWHCFGCSKGGDVFTFLQEVENMEFIEALQFLAERANVDLSRDFQNKTQKNQKNRIKQINKEAARFFHNFLIKMESSEKARGYVKDRGLSKETVDDWSIGFVPDQWELLTKYLLKKGFAIEDLVVAGVTKKKDGKANKKTGHGYYDRFRGRIMFPIRNVHGSVVGFTGRILEADEFSGGKYINTPDTPVYDKSKVVFGLYESKQDIRKKDEIVMVEGQMDVITCHQAGMENVVAVSGTSLTEDQIDLLKRYSTNMKMAFDNDEAGVKAAKRGIRLAMSKGMNVEMIEIPEECGEDPDDCLQNDPDTWFEAVDSSKDIMEWYFDKSFKNRSLDNPKEKQKVTNELLPEIKSISYAVERDHWLQKLADKLGVNQDVLREDMKRFEIKSDKPNKKQESETKTKSSKSRFEKLLEDLLGLLLRFSDLDIEWPFDLPSDAKQKDIFDLYELAQDKYKDGNFNSEQIKNDFESEKLVGFLVMKSEKELPDGDQQEAQKRINRNIEQLKKEWTKIRRKKLQIKIEKAEQEGDEESLEKLLTEFNSLK